MSVIRLAINGYGRIGRCVLRALYESGYRQSMQVVAINEPADIATIAHLTQYDSTHGRFNAQISARDGGLLVNDDFIAVSHVESLEALPWQGLDVDVVLECSGQFSERETLHVHCLRGARRVLLSQPGPADILAVVMGVNHHAIDSQETILSAASCTSNCIVPVIDAIDRVFGIESGAISTIHSMMNDQPVLDAYHHTDLRKTRAASQSMIPVETGLAQGIGRILPNMEGRFTARALRVPTTNVSAIDLSLLLSRSVSVAELNAELQRASEMSLQGILGVSQQPLASCDYNHDPRSGVVDLAQTGGSGRLVNIWVWFDNEWGYANRMLDVVSHWLHPVNLENKTIKRNASCL